MSRSKRRDRRDPVPAVAGTNRRGGFTVVAGACLVAAIGFAALSVDIGMIAYTKTRLQSAVDSAALAAAQEITASVEAAGQDGTSAGDATAIAEGAARAMAVRVAELNGVYLDEGRDVVFGKRSYDKGTGRFTVSWGVAPYNAVKVTAHMDNDDPNAPDAALQMLFASFFGNDSQKLVASAAAFVEARDLVLVLDYTGSMNDDSTFAAFSRLGRTAVEANQVEIFQELGLNLPKLPDTPAYLKLSKSRSGGPTVTTEFRKTSVAVSSPQNITKIVLEFTNGNTQTFTLNAKTRTASGSGSNSGRTIVACSVTSGGKTVDFEDSEESVISAFGLGSYPYPRGSWEDYIDFCRTNSAVNSAGYRWKYGKVSFVQYLLENRFEYTDTPVLWKTSHYPFHAMKEGTSLFCDYMNDLDFGDHVGLVTYDEDSRTETVLDEPLDGASVDISANPITSDYAAIDTIQRHKQAGHYASFTGIGYGVEEAIDLLQTHGRYGARPTILLMTDGNANRSPNRWSVPNGWDWDELTDYDGNGSADYTTSDINKLYAFYQAKQAIDLGYTIHTLSVGADSDDDLMRAIAFAGKGEFIDVPGGSTVADQEEQLRSAFRRIATNVPPAKLLIERD